MCYISENWRFEQVVQAGAVQAGQCKLAVQAGQRKQVVKQYMSCNGASTCNSRMTSHTYVTQVFEGQTVTRAVRKAISFPWPPFPLLHGTSQRLT
jgi:hypothetical protein